MIMYASNTLEMISAYVTENRLKSDLEAAVKYMTAEAKEANVHLEGVDIDFEPEPPDKEKHEVKIRGATSSMTKSLWDSKGSHWHLT